MANDPEATAVARLELAADRLRRLLRAASASYSWRFLRLVGVELWRDELAERAAALAFITLVSLVPFMAALSLVAGPAPDEESLLFTILAWLLPYSEATILAKLREFVDQARAIRDLGLIAFLITALTAFFTIDHTINRIFKVSEQRPYPARLRSFTLVLFWTPVMLAATSSSRYLLDTRAVSAELVSALLAVLPFAVTVLGLTMLYWQVPFTSVRFRSALVGGAVAAILLELLRKGFAIYIEAYEVTRIYGSFGLVILFLVSIQLAWLLVLAGCELAYCIDNRRRLMRRTASASASDAGWMGLAAMVVAFERLRRGKPIVPRNALADRLHLGPKSLDAVLRPLVEAGFLVPSSDGAGYLLAVDPHELPAERVFGVYDAVTDGTLAGLPAPLGPRLDRLRAEVTEGRRQHLDARTLADVVGGQEANARRAQGGARTNQPQRPAAHVERR